MAYSDKPMYSKETGKPIYRKSDGRLIYGDPDDCDCCGGIRGCCGSDNPPGHPQDDAVITIVGECGTDEWGEPSEFCSDWCHEGSGVYEWEGCWFQQGPPTDGLVWYWYFVPEEGHEWRLQINYDLDLDIWQATLWGHNDQSVTYQGGIPPLACDHTTHKLSGSFSLPGLAIAPWCGCVGCTANVTIG